MDAAMMANSILVVVNTLLSLTLVALYGRMLAKIPTRFTAGLLLFAAVFLLQNVFQLYFYATMMDYYAGGVEHLVLIQNALGTLAMGFLTFVTLSPTGRARAHAEPA